MKYIESVPVLAWELALQSGSIQGLTNKVPAILWTLLICMDNICLSNNGHPTELLFIDWLAKANHRAKNEKKIQNW